MNAADSPAPQTPGQVARALDQILSMIATAERLSHDRQVVNLGRLDARVADVCEAIAALPDGEGRRFAPALDRLVAGLDRLERITREAHEVLLAGLDQAPGPERAQGPRASAAYAQAQAVLPSAEDADPQPRRDDGDAL